MVRLDDKISEWANKRFNIFWIDHLVNHDNDENRENPSTYHEITLDGAICKKNNLFKIDGIDGIDNTLSDLKKNMKSNERFGKEIIYICSNDFAIELLKHLSK